MSDTTANVLYNYLGTGSDPKLSLDLGTNGPGWNTYTINYQSHGNIPYSSNPSDQWSTWNVKGDDTHCYGTITLNNNGTKWGNYKAPTDPYDKGYYLKGINYINKSGSYQLTVDEIIRPSATVPIITNSGWSSGMGNTFSKPTPNSDFWILDYGNQNGRWTPDTPNDAIAQSTTLIEGDNGSRAYPVKLGVNLQSYEGGPGYAKAGVWQIDVKLGSNGGPPFCETFYLAERDNLQPGPTNYQDGSGNASGGIGREIDILETQWKPGGPQVNLPNGGNSSWNANQYQSKQMGDWSDVGGIPTKGFLTFGAYINNNQLWLYSYKQDGTQWYCTDAIPLKNSTYNQKAGFVPYIGTWCTNKTSGDFSTDYKNYIFLPPDKLGDLNPKNNPVEFEKTVRNAA